MDELDAIFDAAHSEEAADPLDAIFDAAHSGFRGAGASGTWDEPNRFSAIDSIVSGAPFADEVGAAGRATGNTIKKGLDFLTGETLADPASWADVYTKELERRRAEEARYVDENPIAGNVLPIIGSFGIGGSSAKSTLGTLAKQGATIGGLYGFAGSEGGLQNRAIGGATGAAAGAGAVPATIGAARGLGKLTSSARRALMPLFSNTAADEAAERGAMSIVSNFADTGQVAKDVAAANAAQDAKPWIQKNAYTNLDKFKTTAEVVGDADRPGIATLQEMLTRTGSPESKMQAGALAGDRELARLNILNKLEGSPVSEEAASEVLRPALTKNLEGVKSAVSQAAERAKNPADVVNIWGAKKSISDVERELTRSGAYKPTAEIKAFIDEFRQLPKQVPLQTLQDWRSRAGQLGEALTDRRDQALAKALFSAAGTAEETAIANGTVSKTTAAAIQEMRGLRAQQGTLFDEGGTGKLLEKEFGKFKQDPQTAVPRLTSTLTEAKRTMGAIGPDSAAKGVLARNFMTRASESILTPDKTAINPGRFLRFVEQNKDVAETIGGRRYANSLQIIADDIASQGQVKAAAEIISRGQSITAQGMTNAVALKGAIQAAAGGAINRIPVLGGLVRVLSEKMGADKAAKIEQKLVEFALYPRIAQQMLERATDESLRELSSAFGRFLSGGAARLVGAGAGQTPAVGESSVGIVLNGSEEEGDRQKAYGNGNYYETDNGNDSHTAQASPVSLTTQPQSSNAALALGNIFSGSADGSPISAVFGGEDMPVTAADLVQAVIAQESSGNPRATSEKGAMGLMQIMPATWEWFAPQVAGADPSKPYDPENNKLVGTAYLQYLLDKFGGDPELALAAYHSGEGTIRKLLEARKATQLAEIIDGLGPVGQRYAKEVLARV